MLTIYLLFILFMWIMYWNVHRAGNDQLPNSIKDFVRIHTFDMVAIAKPKIGAKNVDAVIIKLGYGVIHGVEAVGFSRGLWILECKGNHLIQVLDSENHFIHLDIIDPSNNQ